MVEATADAPAEPVIKTRRRSGPRPTKPIPPEEFFARVLLGILASEGVAGLSGRSAIGILSNPQNSPRWYGAYLAMLNGWDRFVAGGTRIPDGQVPPQVIDGLRAHFPSAFSNEE